MSIYDHPVQFKNCVLELFIGDEIGTGASRSVYEIKDEPTKVLKIERTGGTFHNSTEWLIWEEVKDWPIADWFAPCIDIDGWGTALIQRRTKPFENEREFTEALRRTRGGRLPDIFSDTHYHNFGMLNDTLVCHDYGYHKMLRQGASSMCVELGFLSFDPPKPNVTTHRQKGSQLALDL